MQVGVITLKILTIKAVTLMFKLLQVSINLTVVRNVSPSPSVPNVCSGCPGSQFSEIIILLLCSCLLPRDCFSCVCEGGGGGGQRDGWSYQSCKQDNWSTYGLQGVHQGYHQWALREAPQPQEGPSPVPPVRVLPTLQADHPERGGEQVVISLAIHVVCMTSSYIINFLIESNGCGKSTADLLRNFVLL